MAVLGIPPSPSGRLGPGKAACPERRPCDKEQTAPVYFKNSSFSPPTVRAGEDFSLMSMNCKDPVALLEVIVTKLGRPSDYWVRVEFLTFRMFRI